MILQRIFGRRSQPGWPEESEDLLVGRLEALATHQVPDAGERVARRRDALLAQYRRATTDHRERIPFRLPRLMPAMAAAALLVVMIAGGVAASGPGQPFYGVRLAVEVLLLPGTGAARLTAQLDRLDERLIEAAYAAERGDTNAAAAALRAYEEIALELRAGQLPSGTGIVAANERLEAQIRQLERLQAAAPGAGSSEAIGSARSTLTWLAGGGPGGASPSPVPASPQPTSSPASSGGGGSAPPSPASPMPTGAQGSTAPTPTPGASPAGGSGGAGGPSASPGGNGGDGMNGDGPGS